MYRKITIAVLCALLASPSFAAESCSRSPAAKFKPKAALAEKLKKEGFDVRRIKVESGCYEVYAIDKSGHKFNAAYNAETFAKLANAEAGER
jgi:hypothetical protein